jgi:hypothetical protein
MFDRSHFLGSLERTQDFTSNDVGVIERFEAGSELPPLVVSKVVVLDIESTRQSRSRRGTTDRTCRHRSSPAHRLGLHMSLMPGIST